jgi:nitroreductase
MQVYEAIRTLLAVREYRDDPIPDDVLGRILEAARATGSSRNRQEWDFIVVRRRETLTQIGDAATTGRYIAQAALAIAVVVPNNPTGYIDGARAAQDMMLAAWGDGVGSVWVGNVDVAAIRVLLAVPADRMVLTIIPFGYPKAALGRGVKQRKGMSEIAHSEQFGRSFTP